LSGARRFTGERLHEGEALFAVDLARHRAAYEYAGRELAGRRVLELGCGSGYGASSLAEAAQLLVAVDRVAPDPVARSGRARFCRADLRRLPLRPARFDAVVSFQVIEHLEDPTPYLRAIAALLGPDGVALLSTPNVLMSDGVNPYHVHEYRGDELASLLGRHFARVELLGVGTSDRVRALLGERSQRTLRILRLDPLGLRERLPRGLVERLFALGARLVRRRAGADGGIPDASWRDFPIGPAADDAIDWLVVCREPR
jgi:SAM-dependent methyltransferase